jgi:hypothetical protein
MSSALSRSHVDEMTAKETAEMKKLNRIIVKTLHPDLNTTLEGVPFFILFTHVRGRNLRNRMQKYL